MKQLDLAEMRNEIQSKVKEMEGQLQVDQKRLEGPLTAKLVEIIEELGKGQGFSMILRRGLTGHPLHPRGPRHHGHRHREVQLQELTRRRWSAQH